MMVLCFDANLWLELVCLELTACIYSCSRGYGELYQKIKTISVSKIFHSDELLENFPKNFCPLRFCLTMMPDYHFTIIGEGYCTWTETYPH